MSSLKLIFNCSYLSLSPPPFSLLPCNYSHCDAQLEQRRLELLYSLHSKSLKRNHVEPSVSDTAEYQRHIEFLQTKYNSKKWSLSSMLTLLQQTGMQPIYWIRNENPTVKMVLDKFPCLADSKVVIFFNS